LDELVQRFDKVTLEDVNRVAQAIFGNRSMVLTVIGPFKTEELAHLTT
jgi:predicted Zn-dependent peptidase